MCFPTLFNSQQLSNLGLKMLIQESELSYLPPNSYALLFQVTTQKWQHFCFFPSDQRLVTWPTWHGCSLLSPFARLEFCDYKIKKINVGDSQESTILLSFQVFNFMLDKLSEDVTSCLTNLWQYPCLPNYSMNQTPVLVWYTGLLRSERPELQSKWTTVR